MPRKIPDSPLQRLPDSPGVYLLTCNATGDTYVGSATRSIRQRVKGEICGMRMGGFQTSERLKVVAREHGADSFTASVLMLCAPNRVRIHEQEFIHKMKPSLNVRHTGATRSAKIPMDLFCKLLHLAIDMDKAVERLAGELLADAIRRARAELDAKPKSK